MNGDYVRADRWAEALALTAIPPHCETTLKVPKSIALQIMLMNIYLRAFRLFVMTYGIMQEIHPLTIIGIKLISILCPGWIKV